jgi:uncharacterized membrane protein
MIGVTGGRRRREPGGVSMARVVSRKRSIVKAITYRIVVMCLDFTTIYLFTGRIRVAVGFMIASNLYTTAVYLLHERAWAHVNWGVIEKQPEP